MAPAEPDPQTRVRLVALLIGALTVGTLIVIAVASQGAKDADSGLRVERTAGPQGTELQIYVKDEVNTTETTGGRTTVELVCFDRNGQEALRTTLSWPLTDTDGGTLEAHAHQAVPAAEAGELARCRVAGGRGLEADVTEGSIRQ